MKSNCSIPQGPYPAEYPLTGCDQMMFLLDRPEKGSSNFCYAALSIRGVLTSEELESRLRQIDLFQWLSSLSIPKGIPFLTRSWIQTPRTKADHPLTSELPHFSGDLFEFVPETYIDKKLLGDSCLKVFMLPTDSGTSIILAWHHGLLDAHGAELLLRRIGQENGAPENKPILEFPKSGLSAKGQMTREALASCSALAKYFNENFSSDSYIPFRSSRETAAVTPLRETLELSEEESKQVWINCKNYQCEFFRSAFLVATVGKALFETLEEEGSSTELMAALPCDIRRKGSLGPIFPNHLNMLFFSLSSSGSSTLRDCTESVKNQMQKIVSEGFHNAMKKFTELLVRMPKWMGRRFLNYRLKHSFASYVVSYTGQTLVSEKFLNRDVVNFVHFPPNIVPPGLSCIFYEFQGRLRICVITPKIFSKKDWTPRMLQRVRKLLLNGDDSDGI